MKNLIILLWLAFGLIGLSGNVFADNLDSLPKVKREKKLIEMAKEVVLRHGPGYYREYKAPEIRRKIASDTTRDLPESVIAKNQGRSYYTIGYPYNDKEEVLSLYYAAKVYVWGDTGKVFIVEFGIGFGIDDYDTLSEKEKKKLPVVEYHKKTPLKLVTDTIRNANGEVIRIEHKYKK